MWLLPHLRATLLYPDSAPFPSLHLGNCFFYSSSPGVSKMVYTKFVEIGRIVLINYGVDAGKIAAIVNVVDQNRALIDGPSIKRQVVNFKRITLTNIVAKVGINSSTPAVIAAFEKAEVAKKWAETAAAKKAAKKATRANLSDFDRFKVMVAKKNVRAAVAKSFKAEKKALAN
ncbi:hypothetical protein, variant [Fonticula alba]|uniref:Large ribosomal subunit protein eL14 domain-containing protein n=1 Tax=Fonticula alba TaxID=691883 RepID=A0A058ZDM5_FONAL|nr:hypothetical protein H696_00091 [Fonticula alba]XP_009492197.1 hypothetical protein, variant [Fonticula alba]KCV72495.1 hypothetical protein H696_00091 [Fonticula alba]KCV72496.1 hypothetical protein, variant [Fonticula alba]|eukprot:XP_009492196.1 hypothetical protein H696_00091 [Fonticula alba]